MNKDKADKARATYETWVLVKESEFGKRILAELDKIEQQAITGALRGETPDSTNVLFERRGEYKAAQRIRTVFKDVEKENQDAVNWQTSVVPEEAPASAK